MQYDRSTGDSRSRPASPRANDLLVAATLKHVLGYSLEQWSPDGNWSEGYYKRNSFDSVISPFDLEDSCVTNGTAICAFPSKDMCISYTGYLGFPNRCSCSRRPWPDMIDNYALYCPQVHTAIPACDRIWRGSWSHVYD